ncbi:hypothetical protein [Ammoniphilus sp. YIM 78166]|nr:hypothetical protein [Ammoniphilus sp. YIM 78166]
MKVRMAFYTTVINLMGIKLLKNGEGNFFIKLGSGKIRPLKA